MSEKLNIYSFSDSVSSYLNEIGKIPLLSREEEKKLFERLKSGDKNAREIIINSNLRLVVNIAKIYSKENVSILDLIQEGNLGLMQAVDRYDLTKDVPFGNFAPFYIRREIANAVRKYSRNIVITESFNQKIVRFRDVQRELTIKLSHEPTIQEIAKEMQISYLKALEIFRYQADARSLNEVINENNDGELVNFIDNSNNSIDDYVIKKDLQERIQFLLKKIDLKPQEIEVIMLRYGFNDGRTYTLVEIAKMLNLTKERIRQIEAKALKKLRLANEISNFAIFTCNEKKALHMIDKYRLKYDEAGSVNKSFLREYNYKNIDDVKRKKYKTIYQYFDGYDKEEVDRALEEINEYEKELLYLRYGKDFNVAILSQLNKTQSNYLYGYVLPKIKRIIDKNKDEKRKIKEMHYGLGKRND